MKILTICSSPYLSLTPLTAQLENSGLPEGLASNETPPQNYEEWHQHVFDAYEQDASGLLTQQSLSPGKVWQDMAGQLIHANLSKKQWFWASSKAGWLLDFWLALEPQSRFALIYSPPHIGISQCLSALADDNIKTEIAVENWINYHTELLRFYRSYPNQCILVNYQHCVEYPSQFVQACKQYLSFDINTTLSSDDSTEVHDQSIEATLFAPIEKHYPEIGMLFQELEASATPCYQQQEKQNKISSKDTAFSAWQRYVSLKSQEKADAEFKIQLQQQLDSSQAVLIEYTEQTKEVTQKNEETEADNELLLLQLHQVQEELEHYFLRYQEQESIAKSKGLLAFVEHNTESDSAPIKSQLIQVNQEQNSLVVDLINLQWQAQSWSQYRLHIMASDDFNDQPTFAAIKLPEQINHLLPLKTWPPQTADESGAYWEITTQLLEGELTHSTFYPEDIAFLHALFKQLPLWLKSLEKTLQLKNNDWSAYYQSLEEIKPVLDDVFKLQEISA